MPLFARYIAIDWSGAATASEGVDLAIVQAGRGTVPTLVRPPAVRGRKKWSRGLCAEWLCAQLGPAEPRTLVLVDAGFGYPSGTARAIFGVSSWADLVAAIGKSLGVGRTARSVAMDLNARFPGGSPFRFDGSRSDARWYAQHGVPYYRQTEVLVPQAISQFYLGSGGVVGFHTITLLATLDDLFRRRVTGQVAFDVWPQEVPVPCEGRHVLAECYPALCRSSVEAVAANSLNEHESDATAACEWARRHDESDQLAPFFALREVPIGRDTRKTWREQVEEEGWIVGVTCGPSS